MPESMLAGLLAMSADARARHLRRVVETRQGVGDAGCLVLTGSAVAAAHRESGGDVRCALSIGVAALRAATRKVEAGTRRHVFPISSGDVKRAAAATAGFEDLDGASIYCFDPPREPGEGGDVDDDDGFPDDEGPEVAPDDGSGDYVDGD